MIIKAIVIGVGKKVTFRTKCGTILHSDKPFLGKTGDYVSLRLTEGGKLVGIEHNLSQHDTVGIKPEPAKNNLHHVDYSELDSHE